MIRLAAINGQQTVEVGDDPIVAWALSDKLAAGELVIEKGLLVCLVNGAVTYSPVGEVNLLEATGLLGLASRRIERDASE